MAKENTFWMQTGGAFWLGRNPKPRSGVAIYKIPVIDVNKALAARTEYIDDDWIWIGSYLCAKFRDPVSGNVYAQPVAVEET